MDEEVVNESSFSIRTDEEIQVVTEHIDVNDNITDKTS